MKNSAIRLLGLVAIVMGLMPVSALAQTETYFVPIEPCRLVDTRQASDASGMFGNGQTRDFYTWGTGLNTAQGGAFECGVPSTAVAVHVNFTAVNPTGFGYLRAWPYGTAEPNATLMAYTAGPGISNATALATCTEGLCDFDISVKLYLANTHLVIDVVGYYVPPVVVAAEAEATKTRR